MLIASMLDETLIERMITGFREEEFVLPGFTRQSMIRGLNEIAWVWVMEINEHPPETFSGFFEDTEIVYFRFIGKAFRGDVLKVRYRLTWHGGGGDDHIVLLPNSPGEAQFPLMIGV